MLLLAILSTFRRSGDGDPIDAPARYFGFFVLWCFGVYFWCDPSFSYWAVIVTVISFNTSAAM